MRSIETTVDRIESDVGPPGPVRVISWRLRR
jgi:hypothetical protein